MHTIFLIHLQGSFLSLVYSTEPSKAVVLVLVLLFVALWFILQGDLFYVLPCVILFLCFSVLLAFQLPRLGKRELIWVLFVLCSICACLDLSVSSSSWCLGRAAVCDCGTPWTFLSSLFIKVVTLKIRSRSPKSNHFTPLSWWCISVSLVKFQPLLKEIVCTQTFFCIKKKIYKGQ